MWKCILQEDVTLEYKSSCCYVLWQLDGSRRASQCDDAHLSPLVSGAVREETYMRVYLVFLSVIDM